MTTIEIDIPEWANDPLKRADIELYKKYNDPSKWFYGSEVRDNILLRDPVSLPRYGHLARKALMYYAGDRYNPHTITMSNELHIRQLIQAFIAQKVLGEIKDYDCEFLNNFFAFAIGNILDIDIPHNSARIDQGIKDELKTPLYYMTETRA